MNRTHLKFLRTKASKLKLHNDGTVSYKLPGEWRWHHSVDTLSRDDFLKLAQPHREKLWFEGFRRRRDFVEVGQVGNFAWPYV